MKKAFAAMGLILFGLAALGFAVVPVETQVKQPAPSLPLQIACPLISGPILIDGKLDDAAWSKAPWSDPFVDIEGDKKPKPPLETRVKMLHDDKALYIAAKLEEPHLQGVFTEHDSYIFHLDNDFEVFLDPDGDGQNYGELEMNALNTTWDLLLTRAYRDGGQALDSWEIKGLKTAVALDGTINNPADVDKGWTIEIRIPWKSLAEIGGKTPPKPGDRWRIAFSRVEWEWDIKDGKYVKKAGKPERNWVWSPQGEINMHLPERWGSVVFTGAEDGNKPLPEDFLAPARLHLGRVHQEMLARREKKGTFALDQTMGAAFQGPKDWTNQSLATTKNLYEYRLGHSNGTVVTISQDGRLQESGAEKK